MRWPWQRESRDHCEDKSRLAEAERQVEDIKARADKVAQQLEARLRRNHWGETVATIARREL